MEIIHNLGSLKIKKGTDENIGFLLTNKRGSYCNFFNEPSSRYNGLFFFDEESMSMYKFIDDIEINGNPEILGLKNNFFYVERKRNVIAESFLMPKDLSSLIYELNYENVIDLILDCKNTYDNREFGRCYNISEEEGCIIIKFTKKSDKREDSTDGVEEFVLYLAIKNDTPFYEKRDMWIERNYSYDKGRNSIPFSRYVYNPLRLKGTKFVFSMSKKKEDALKQCKFIFNNLNEIKNEEKNYFLGFLKKINAKKILKNRKIRAQIKAAYLNALNSLNNLTVSSNDYTGIFAGYPWFFQFWSRDTLISLKALSKINTELATKILFDNLKNIGEDGRLPNLSGKHGSINLGNADAHGWLFFRCKEFVEKNNKKIIYEIESAVEKSLHGLSKYHTMDNFEINENKETWIDTDFGNDGRNVARIEIQALRLNMYKLMYGLTQNQKYKILENMLKSNLRQKFWNGKLLADGLEDFTIRPNIFIACYVYSNSLLKKEWEICFDNALKNLWLDWGGLTTIDKNNKLFTDKHSGQDNKSYHRGDSWFWLNNLAAIVLNRINKNKFKKQIKKIIDASTEEILWKGCIGCHAELSSAIELSSQGCFNQAWSNAIYVEMIDELFG